MKNDALIWALKLEHAHKERHGIYGETQRSLAYNSNHIEGSTLTKDQTTALFEEGYLPSTDQYYVSRDVEEMTGHFLMFNKMLSYIGQPLSEDIIKSFHYELKAGVFIDRANGYAIGDYKKLANMVGNVKVVLPQDVPDKMRELLEWYHGQSSVTLSTLAELHVRYEFIHPFQDGNGRTGRIILFRECLEKDITPFIIHSENRLEYITSLEKAQKNDDLSALITLFAKEQEDYAEICKTFDIFQRYENYLKYQKDHPSKPSSRKGPK